MGHRVPETRTVGSGVQSFPTSGTSRFGDTRPLKRKRGDREGSDVRLGVSRDGRGVSVGRGVSEGTVGGCQKGRSGGSAGTVGGCQ